MRVNYINAQIIGDYARITVLGYVPGTKKRRRPVIDLDASDFARLVEIAKEFRTQQRRAAQRANFRAQDITNAGVTE